MITVLFEAQPKNCASCPFKDSITRNKCGMLIDNKQTSSGSNIQKIPDKRCFIQNNKKIKQ